MRGRGLGVVEALSVGAHLPVVGKRHEDHRVARCIVVDDAVLAIDVLQDLLADDLVTIEVVASVGHLVGHVVITGPLKLGQHVGVDHVGDVDLARGQFGAQLDAVGLDEGADEGVVLQHERLGVELRAVRVAAANEVEEDLVGLTAAAEADDGLSVGILAEGDDGGISLILQVNGHLGHFAHRVAVAASHGLDRDALGRDNEGLSVGRAQLVGFRAVEGVEHLCAGDAARDGHLGGQLLIAQRDGRLRSLRDGSLRGAQQGHGVADDLGSRRGIGQHLLCVGQIEESVVAHVVRMDGHVVLAAVRPCQDGVGGEVASQREHGIRHVIGHLQHKDGRLGIGVLDELDVAEERMRRIGDGGKLDVAHCGLAASPSGIEIGIQVKHRQEGPQRLQVADDVVARHRRADDHGVIGGQVVAGERCRGLDGRHVERLASQHRRVGQVAVQAAAVEQCRRALLVLVLHAHLYTIKVAAAGVIDDDVDQPVAVVVGGTLRHLPVLPGVGLLRRGGEVVADARGVADRADVEADAAGVAGLMRLDDEGHLLADGHVVDREAHHVLAATAQP